MRLKYYLRGAGVGMIVTTLVFAIALMRYEPELSADEIRQKAAKLGMVMAEETASGNAQEKVDTTESDVIKEKDDTKESSDSEEKDDTKESSAVEEKNSDEEKSSRTTKETQKVRFVIQGGEFSDVVSNNLESKGLVKDGEAYNKWLMKHDYDGEILPGVYYIDSDATYQEIAEIITTKQE